MTARTNKQAEAKFNRALADELRKQGVKPSGAAWARCKAAHKEFPYLSAYQISLLGESESISARGWYSLLTGMELRRQSEVRRLMATRERVAQFSRMVAYCDERLAKLNAAA